MPPISHPGQRSAIDVHSDGGLSGLQSSVDSSEDEKLFIGTKPLMRLLILSVGPLVSQLVLAAFGLLETFWATRTNVGPTRGLAVLGDVYAIEFISIAISQYFMTGYSARASFCFGRQRADVASQLFIDFLRMVLIAGAITIAIIIPATRPLIKWFGGASSDFLDDCFAYMRVQSYFSFARYVYQLGCGAAECEGKAVRFAFLQLLALAGEQVFAAIFVLGFRMGLPAIRTVRAGWFPVSAF